MIETTAFYTDLVSKNWYAIYTIVKHEKTASATLARKGIETFLPVRDVRNRWKDRIKKIQLPLFPGYLFTHISICSSEKFKVLNTPGVVRILGTGSNPLPVPNEQIDAIKVLLESRLAFEPDLYCEQGKEAVVVRGPLFGVKGTVVEKRGNYRLILSVEIIQRSVAVEVDIRDVELG